MKSLLFLFLLLTFFITAFVSQNDFLSEQRKFERVKQSYTDKGALIEKRLKGEDIDPNKYNILINVYKEEQELEIYAKNVSDLSFKKILTYDICEKSGLLGPKRKKGDCQVPEGFYYIDRYNPASSFYLSLGLNYPNQADRIKSSAKDLGGDIFIHGSCVTIGCMPMTNDKIKEIYLYAIQARQSGQLKVPVYIYPYRMTSENVKLFAKRYNEDKALLNFWVNLKTGYDLFNEKKKALKISVDKSGNYCFQ